MNTTITTPDMCAECRALGCTSRGHRCGGCGARCWKPRRKPPHGASLDPASQCPQCQDEGDFDAETGVCVNCFYPEIRTCVVCGATSDLVRFASTGCLPCYNDRERAVRMIARLNASIATMPWEG